MSGSIEDDLADYNSEEDEDFVPLNHEEDNDENDNDEIDEEEDGEGGKKSRNRKRKSNVQQLRPGITSVKKVKSSTIGAAVISDDDDEEDLTSYTTSHITTIAPSSLQTSSRSSHRSSNHDADIPAIETSTTSLLSTSISTAPSSSQISLLPTDISPSSRRPPPPKESLNSIMAQFNKKITAKPVVKKIINSWEVVKKPHPNSISTTLPTTLSSNNVTITSSSPSEVESTDTSKNTSITPPSGSTPLSTEQIKISEFASYAGETIQVTKTLIKGSAEEKAHRLNHQDNLSSLLSSLQHKSSLSTLEKSRLDWSISKEEEGDEEELKAFTTSKDGYVDKMVFLKKTEEREAERLKEIRNKRRGTVSASLAGRD